MQKIAIFSWVDRVLVNHLDDLRRSRPHLPTLQAMAALAVRLGVEALESGASPTLSRRALPGSPRRAIGLWLPRQTYQRVLQVSHDTDDAPTRSAALRLVLWIGVNRLLEMEEEKATRQSA